MPKQFTLILAIFFAPILLLSSQAHAADEGSLILRFQGFEGKGCKDQKSSAGLYIDKVSSNYKISQIPWRQAEGNPLESGTFSLPINQIPSASDKVTEVNIRYYAIFNQYDADHYIATKNLTKEFLEQLTFYSPKVLIIPARPRFEAKPQHDCSLKLEFIKIPAATQELKSSTSVEGASASEAAN